MCWSAFTTTFPSSRLSPRIAVPHVEYSIMSESGWRQRLRLPLMIGGPALAVIVFLIIYLTGGRFEGTDDAYVQTASVAVSSNVAGRVLEVDVRDNQSVHKGDVLFRLDDEPFRIAVEEAAAQLSGARLQVESLKAS